MNSEKLMEIYQLLYKRYGQQHWWPGQSRFETALGAILTQNTNWKNVEKAIKNLKHNRCLDAAKLYKMDISILAEMIRPAGYYNIKAKRLKNFLDWLFENHDGQLERLCHVDVYSLRQELLGIKGIGPETADSILLYALDKPVFVVDTYTCRLLGRHGLIEEGADYQSVQDFFQGNLQSDPDLFNEYHALLVCVGKEYCKKTPNCTNCPLEGLPHDIEPEF